MICEATIKSSFVESLLMSAATLSTLHTLTHLIIIITLQVSFFPYFSDREIEAQNGKVSGQAYTVYMWWNRYLNHQLYDSFACVLNHFLEPPFTASGFLKGTRE